MTMLLLERDAVTLPPAAALRSRPVTLPQPKLAPAPIFKHWNTREVDLLRKHYPAGGAEACREVLPGRTASAIHGKANALGVRQNRRGSKRRRHQVGVDFDQQVQALYARGLKRGDVARFADINGVPRWFVLKRAQALGLAFQRVAPTPWSRRELELLQEHAAKTPVVIARLLRAQGYKRSPTAVTVQIKRRHIDRDDPDTWSASSLAPLLGVDSKTITKWIATLGLPAERRGTQRTAAQGGDEWVIRRASLRLWIRDHAVLIDLRKVDRFWFIDLAFG